MSEITPQFNNISIYPTCSGCSLCLSFPLCVSQNFPSVPPPAPSTSLPQTCAFLPPGATLSPIWTIAHFFLQIWVSGTVAIHVPNMSLTWQTIIVFFMKYIYHSVGYLALGSDGWSAATLPLMLSPCNIMILWFSFFSSKISCWACVMASHGLAALGSPDGSGNVVAPGFIQEICGGVPWLVTPLFAPPDWKLDAKCDGGTRSSLVSPNNNKNDRLCLCACT